MSNHLRRESLESLIASSELVIVARPAQPPEREERISITPPDRKPSESFPPFIRIRRRYVVEEVLYSRSRRAAESLPGPLPPPFKTEDDTPALGELIEVDEASYEYFLDVHRRRYVDRVHKITLQHVYESEDPPDKVSGPRLVFLQRRGRKDWHFAYDRGEEGISLRARVEKLLAGKKD